MKDREKIEKLEIILRELPKEKRMEVYTYIAKIYEDFSRTILLEQAAGVSTGLAQSIHGKNALVKIDLSLNKEYGNIAAYLQQQAQKLKGET